MIDSIELQTDEPTMFNEEILQKLHEQTNL